MIEVLEDGWSLSLGVEIFLALDCGWNPEKKKKTISWSSI